MRLSVLLSLLLAISTWSASAVTAADPIVPADAKLELLFTRSAPIQGGLTEGAAVAPDGSIYFSDIPEGADQGQILRFDPVAHTTSVFAENSYK
jgi:streptogramin lyase